MEARPPALIERTVHLLLPPQARESVAGDLREIHPSPWPYMCGAARTLPYVVASQIRRSANLPALGIQALMLQGCLGGFRVNAIAMDAPRWARAAVPASFALIGLVLRDAYRSTDRSPIDRALLDIFTVVFSIALSQTILAVLANAGAISHDWMVGPSMVFIGAVSLPMLFILRIALDFENDFSLSPDPHDKSTADLLAEYRQFAKLTRTRLRAEIATGLFIVALIATSFLWTHFSIYMLIGLCWITGHGFVMRHLAKAMPPTMPPDLGFGGSLGFYRKELERQRRMRRFVWWWYFIPFYSGIVMDLIGRGIRENELTRTSLGFAAAILLGFCITKLVQKRKRSLDKRIKILDDVRETQ